MLGVEPKDDVTITPTSSDDNGDVSATTSNSNNKLVFTSTNWETAQTVTLTASDVDADKEITISHTIEGSKEYKALTGTETVVLTVKAKEVPGVIISTAKFNLNEGTTGTYTVGLTKKPTGNVIIRVSGNDDVATVSPASLSFTPVDWATLKTVTVSGTEDEDAVDGIAMITHSITDSAAAEYASLSVSGVEVTVKDDETAGITFTPTDQTIDVDEGETTNYTIKLSSKPAGTSDVTVELNIDTDKQNIIGLSSELLTFTTTNWNTAQRVVITGIDDLDHKDEEVTINHVVTGSDDSGYGDVVSFKTRITVTVTDDDEAGITFSRTKIGITKTKMTTYTVALDSQPSGNVTIVPTSADVTKVTVATTGTTTTTTAKLVFTTANWNTAQTVTITGKDTAAAQNITHVITGDDTVYNALTDPTIAVTIVDNATSRVVISNTKLKITEGGSAGTFTIVLSKVPTGSVVVTTTVPSTAAGDIGVLPATATFNTATWNTPQTITVTAIPDADADDPSDATLTLTVGGGGITATVPSVVVTVKDNDTKGAMISVSELSIIEGSKSTYTVKLKSQPSANVVINVIATPAATPANVKLTHIPVATPPSTVEVVLTALTFTNANWNVAQTVIVEGIEDASATDDIGNLYN